MVNKCKKQTNYLKNFTTTKNYNMYKCINFIPSGFLFASLLNLLVLVDFGRTLEKKYFITTLYYILKKECMIKNCTILNIQYL